MASRRAVGASQRAAARRLDFDESTRRSASGWLFGRRTLRRRGHRARLRGIGREPHSLAVVGDLERRTLEEYVPRLVMLHVDAQPAPTEQEPECQAREP